MSKIILGVEGLTVYRENRAAVQDVSFCLEAGTDMAIIGPNGAGKSTLIRVRPSYDTFSNQGNSCLAKLSWNPFKNHIVN